MQDSLTSCSFSNIYYTLQVTMQQFEYKTLNIPLRNALFSKKQEIPVEVLEQELNLMGKKGWELAGQFTRQKNGFSQYAILIFKRPVVLPTPKNT